MASREKQSGVCSLGQAWVAPPSVGLMPQRTIKVKADTMNSVERLVRRLQHTGMVLIWPIDRYESRRKGEQKREGQRNLARSRRLQLAYLASAQERKRRKGLFLTEEGP